MKYRNKVSRITNAYATGSNDYVSTVQALLDAYVTRGTAEDSMAPLLSVLGCRNVRYMPGSTINKFEAPRQPDAVHEEIVTKTLLVLLRLHMTNNAGSSRNNAFAILDGLAKNKRWHTCLESVTAANDLATLLIDASFSLNCFTPSGDRSTLALVAACLPSLYAILNEWLVPVAAFYEKTSMSEVARTVFGDAWYELTFGGEAWFELTFGGEAWFESPRNNHSTEINNAILTSIHTNPPPFRAGLLRAGAGEQEWVELPKMDMP
jgi:hypothetical protein